MSFLSDYPQLVTIQDIARRKKIPIFLVGGFLRDLQLGVEKKDFDFAVGRDALAVARLFARKIKGAFVLLDRERGCARVAKKIGGALYTFDFADFRAKTFSEDLSHRDFTINTLSLDLLKLKTSTPAAAALLDAKGGLRDLKEKRIRRVSPDAFQEDPLRMMRAFSLKATLGFKIEAQTLSQIRREKDLISRVSYERIREELFKILESDAAARVLKAMDRVGLLAKIIPQVKVMGSCKQGTYHHLDVWPHSLETVAQMEKVFKEMEGDARVAGYLRETLGGNRGRRALMKLAALLHDIGKPDTRKKEPGGRVSFHGHEHVGKNIVKHIGGLLKLSVGERRTLEDMVRWHLRPGYLSNFKQPSEKAVYRYFRDTKETAVAVLLLSLADQRATRGPATTQADQEHHEAVCLGLVRRFFKKKDENPLVRLITGDDLIKGLKLSPSPLFAKILKAVEERQSLGELKDKREALALAKKIAEKEAVGR
jgi:putative nucleotidyltransferase with HDIG domain